MGLFYLDIAKNMLPFSRYPYRGAIVACPVCRSGRHAALSRLDRRLKLLPTVLCEDCGLIYTNPMPTEAEMAVYYAKYYRFDYQFAASGPTARRLEKRRREAGLRAARIRDILPERARILDFGAGSGEFVETMLDAGFDAHGFEPGETYGGFARARLGDRIRIAGWQAIEHDAEFDLVSSFHVFEHLIDPVAALRRMATWLKPDGLAFVEVPNSLKGLAQKGFGSFHFAHVIGFNQHNLSLAAAKAGLVPVHVLSPTSIVFQKSNASSDVAALAAMARQATASCRLDLSPGSRFLQYQLSKAAGVVTRRWTGTSCLPLDPGMATALLMLP